MEELTEQDLKNLTIPEPPEDFKGYSRYGDCVREYAANMPIIGYNDTILELQALIRQQALDSLNLIYKEKREKPLGVQFWEDKSSPHEIIFGWYAWTDKKV